MGFLPRTQGSSLQNLYRTVSRNIPRVSPLFERLAERMERRNSTAVGNRRRRCIFGIIRGMRILITGTTGGIGGAVAGAAASAGDAVVALNRSDWGRLAAFLEGEKPFDAVVFSTGECRVKPLAQTKDEDFAEAMRVNCGLFLSLMRELVTRRLNAENGMSVVAVSSVSAREGWPGGGLYCASKGALSALCRALDAELAPRKISVRALEPRYVRTKMFASCAGRMGVPAALAEDPAVFAEKILKELKS